MILVDMVSRMTIPLSPGTVTVHGLPAMVIPMGGAPAPAGMHIDGIVGTTREEKVPGMLTPGGDQCRDFPFATGGTVPDAFFRKCAVSFDFEAMLMVMPPGSSRRRDAKPNPQNLHCNSHPQPTNKPARSARSSRFWPVACCG
ncbi:MAG: hypothetical protein EPN49_00820 [Rhodanobacter sp.]|nr:MAG: hypothetical protein EPN49_00820 [Rhodanobacter sp.]